MTYLICNKPADLAEHWEQYRQLRTNQDVDLDGEGQVADVVRSIKRWKQKT